ncbi:MAG: hypothetical protein LBH58_05290 [Tannerellaceae bacterium]|jgi:hypothetical protein|nr:hypothetical protein [Tannerellaceae bacterium]
MDSIEKTDCLVSGILLYDNDGKYFQIREVISNTIDVVNIYFVTKSEMDLSEYINQSIQVAGTCCRKPEQANPPAGTTLYNMEVKSLNFIKE